MYLTELRKYARIDTDLISAVTDGKLDLVSRLLSQKCGTFVIHLPDGPVAWYYGVTPEHKGVV